MALWFFKYTEWHNILSEITSPDLTLGVIETLNGHGLAPTEFVVSKKGRYKTSVFQVLGP